MLEFALLNRSVKQVEEQQPVKKDDESTYASTV